MADVVGYIRVSTDEQAESRAGLAAQRLAIVTEAERRGWRVVDIVEDAGYSGKDLKRPGIAVALEALRTRRADTLVVAKLDRLSRSMLDFATVMATATKQHWALVALDLGLDSTTPSGEMQANILATFAQFERRLISERTKSALAAKRAAGVRIGGRPRVSKPVSRRIQRMRSTGMTYQAIADTLNVDGVTTAMGGAAWYPSTVRYVALHAEP